MYPILVSWPRQTLPGLVLALARGGWLLAGCNSRPAPPSAAPPSKPTAAQVAATSASVAPPAPPPLAEPALLPGKLKAEPADPPYRMLAGETMRYYRYAGRLGAQPVVVELLTSPKKYDLAPALSGSYYTPRHGTTSRLSFNVFDPHQRLRFAAYPADDSTEHWQAQQPLGPRLTGTVTAADKPRRRFVLQADYREAVPLVIRTATMHGKPVTAEFGDRGEPGQFTGSYRHQYIQLLGSAAQRPELQRSFPSRPAQVRARLRQEFRAGEADFADIDEHINLQLNDYGILSYAKYISDFGVGAAHPQHVFESWSYDLHTGRRITLASFVKPGSTAALRRLALRHIDPDYLAGLQSNYEDSHAGAEHIKYIDWASEFGLTPEGLVVTSEIGSHAMGPVTITIPYAELRPLLRPRTPLNRALVARGLQPVL